MASVTAVKGGRFTRKNHGKVVGPTSYANPGGQTIYANSFGLRAFQSVTASMSVSGTYYGQWQPKSADPNTQAVIHWFVTATGVEVANTTNLSAETLIVSVRGG